MWVQKDNKSTHFLEKNFRLPGMCAKASCENAPGLITGAPMMQYALVHHKSPVIIIIPLTNNYTKKFRNLQ